MNGKTSLLSARLKKLAGNTFSSIRNHRRISIILVTVIIIAGLGVHLLSTGTEPMPRLKIGPIVNIENPADLSFNSSGNNSIETVETVSIFGGCPSLYQNVMIANYSYIDLMNMTFPIVSSTSNFTWFMNSAFLNYSMEWAGVESEFSLQESLPVIVEVTLTVANSTGYKSYQYYNQMSISPWNLEIVNCSVPVFQSKYIKDKSLAAGLDKYSSVSLVNKSYSIHPYFNLSDPIHRGISNIPSNTGHADYISSGPSPNGNPCIEECMAESLGGKTFTGPMPMVMLHVSRNLSNYTNFYQNVVYSASLVLFDGSIETNSVQTSMSLGGSRAFGTYLSTNPLVVNFDNVINPTNIVYTHNHIGNDTREHSFNSTSFSNTTMIAISNVSYEISYIGFFLVKHNIDTGYYSKTEEYKATSIQTILPTSSNSYAFKIYNVPINLSMLMNTFYAGSSADSYSVETQHGLNAVYDQASISGYNNLMDQEALATKVICAVSEGIALSLAAIVLMSSLNIIADDAVPEEIVTALSVIGNVLAARASILATFNSIDFFASSKLTSMDVNIGNNYPSTVTVKQLRTFKDLTFIIDDKSYSTCIPTYFFDVY